MPLYFAPLSGVLPDTDFVEMTMPQDFSALRRHHGALLLAACLAVLPAAHANPVAASAASAEHTAAAAPAASDEALHQQLRVVRDAMQQALNRRDLDALLAHVTDDVVFTTMNGDRVIGKDGIRDYFNKMLGGDQAVVKSVQAQFEVAALSHLYNGDTAVAFGHSRDDYELANGDRWQVTPQWSATLVRRGDAWLIANFHYSVNMFDNPILSAQRSLLLAGGGVAALTGLLAGWLLGRRKRRG